MPKIQTIPTAVEGWLKLGLDTYAHLGMYELGLLCVMSPARQAEQQAEEDKNPVNDYKFLLEKRELVVSLPNPILALRTQLQADKKMLEKIQRRLEKADSDASAGWQQKFCPDFDQDGKYQESFEIFLDACKSYRDDCSASTSKLGDKETPENQIRRDSIQEAYRSHVLVELKIFLRSKDDLLISKEGKRVSLILKDGAVSLGKFIQKTENLISLREACKKITDILRHLSQLDELAQSIENAMMIETVRETAKRKTAAGTEEEVSKEVQIYPPLSDLSQLRSLKDDLAKLEKSWRQRYCGVTASVDSSTLGTPPRGKIDLLVGELSDLPSGGIQGAQAEKFTEMKETYRQIYTKLFSMLEARLHLPRSSFRTVTSKRVDTYDKRIQQLADYSRERPVSLIHLEGAPVIVNPERAEEVFFPVRVIEKQGECKGADALYVLPWQVPDRFTGAKRFVTAGCMLGTNVLGLDQYNRSLPLIKHQLPFFPGQRVEKISYNEHVFNPYEGVLLLEIEKIARLIKAMAKKAPTEGNNPELVFHLPKYDYILSGIELFVRGRITLSALERFCAIVLKHARHYESRLSKICKQHDIELRVVNPFSDFFDDIIQDVAPGSIIPAILASLDIEMPAVGKDGGWQLGREITTRLLKKLRSAENRNEELRDVWERFTDGYLRAFPSSWLQESLSLPAEEIEEKFEATSPFDELFSLANAVVIGVAGRDCEQGELCSILPISEKQIQVTCNSIISKLPGYSKPAFLTYLDSVVAYSEYNQGSIFYLECMLEGLNRLLQEKSSAKAVSSAFAKNSGRQIGHWIHPAQLESFAASLSGSDDSDSERADSSIAGDGAVALIRDYKGLFSRAKLDSSVSPASAEQQADSDMILRSPSWA